MLITRISAYSGKSRTIDIPCTQEQYLNWENGLSIQKAMPNVSPADREFILNGITAEEWDIMYPAEDDEDEDIIPPMTDEDADKFLRDYDRGISGFDDPNHLIDDTQ